MLDGRGLAQEFHLDLGPGGYAFGKARHGHQPVGPHERHDDAGRALQRGGDDAVAHATDAHPDEFVLAGVGDELARGDGPHHAARLGRAAQAFLDQRTHEKLEGEGGGDGITGDSQHRLAAGHAQHHRVPGPYRDAVYEHPAEVGDDARAEVLAARGRPGVDDHDVGGIERGLGGGADGLEVVGHDVAAQRLGAPGLGQRAQHQAVELDQFAGLRSSADGHQFAAGWDYRHAGRLDHVYLGVAGGGQRAQVARLQAAALGDHQFRSHDVLAHRPHVLPGRGGGDDLDHTVAAVVDVFHHDHGVGVRRHGVAGVDPDSLGSQPQPSRGCLRGADRAGGGHRYAVHGGGGKVRTGERRPDGFGRDVAERPVQWQPQRPAGRPVGEFGQRLGQAIARRGQRHVVQVDRTLIRARRFGRQPRRPPPARRRPAGSV